MAPRIEPVSSTEDPVLRRKAARTVAQYLYPDKQAIVDVLEEIGYLSYDTPAQPIRTSR